MLVQGSVLGALLVYLKRSSIKMDLRRTDGLPFLIAAAHWAAKAEIFNAGFGILLVVCKIIGEREIEAITRRLEAGLVLVVGDDRVRHVARVEPADAGRSGLRELAFHGGGGTDFTPLLQEADTHRPDIGVVLTDLQGPARFQPRWPVIWAVPAAHAGAVAPFGRVLVLD